MVKEEVLNWKKLDISEGFNNSFFNLNKLSNSFSLKIISLLKIVRIKKL